MKPETNSILAFDELDRQCANFFLAKKVAARGQREIDRWLSGAERQHEITAGRLIAEGWSLLSDAQAALAHTCIVMFSVKSAKLTFLYEQQKAATQSLQQRFEEEWTKIEDFPIPDARIAIDDLRHRLRDYLVFVQSEIVVDRTNGGALGGTSNTGPVVLSGSPLSSQAATSLAQRSPLLQESRKSPHRQRRTTPSTVSSTPGAASASAENVFFRSSPPSLSTPIGTLSNNQHDGLYDLVDRISTFSLQEKSLLAATIFGDDFGGGGRIYRPFGVSGDE